MACTSQHELHIGVGKRFTNSSLETNPSLTSVWVVKPLIASFDAARCDAKCGDQWAMEACDC